MSNSILTEDAITAFTVTISIYFFLGGGIFWNFPTNITFTSSQVLNFGNQPQCFTSSQFPNVWHNNHNSQFNMRNTDKKDNFSKRSARPSPSFQSKFYTLLALPFPDQPRLARRDLNAGAQFRGRAGAFSYPPSSPSLHIPRIRQERANLWEVWLRIFRIFLEISIPDVVN